MSNKPSDREEPFLCFERRTPGDVVAASQNPPTDVDVPVPFGAAGIKILGSAAYQVGCRPRAARLHGCHRGRLYLCYVGRPGAETRNGRSSRLHAIGIVAEPGIKGPRVGEYKVRGRCMDKTPLSTRPPRAEERCVGRPLCAFGYRVCVHPLAGNQVRAPGAEWHLLPPEWVYILSSWTY
jgi:hypothetical protein